MVPRINTIAFLGSYTPRQCGIATFTKHLRDAVAGSAEGLQTLVLAVDDNPQGHPYGPEVRFQLQVNRPEDYRTAAELLNIKQIDIFNLQHEFGIYGGRCGDLVLSFLRRLRMPIVTTLHTVLQGPSREQKAIIHELGRLSDRLVVMAERAVGMLHEVYDVPREKIVMIPHGIHDLPFTDSAFYKGQFGLDDRIVILTFGLLSPGKGIEVAIRALPQIIARHPEVMYMVVGATHPHIFRREGPAYLNSLERLAERLGVGEHVSFHHRYVSEDELAAWLSAADFYLTPYLGQAQITSGTLAYAMGAGKAVVSTPFRYAEEMLAEDRGRLFPFGDSQALAEAV
ncbi:MAG: glycosyltransferase, partial [Planctomycetes bacterium]|nr:glycosyltransferase [Planctomycetota bacterium]